MKAITAHRSRLFAIAAAVLALTGSCVTPPPPTPVRIIPIAPVRAPPAAPRRADWRDAPLTEGTWRWSGGNGGSRAVFVGRDGAMLASLTCERSAARVVLARAGPAQAQVAMAVTTTLTAARPLLSDPLLGDHSAIATALSARDPLLDDIVFSRGRFVFDVGGQAALTLPNWPEIARVVEDCRA